PRVRRNRAPRPRPPGVPREITMIDEPRAALPTPPPDARLEPVFLHIYAHRKKQWARRDRAERVGRVPLPQPLPVRRVAPRRKWLPKDLILECLLQLRVPRRRLGRLGNLGPREPADRGIQGVDMKPGDRRVRRRRRR